MTVKRTRRNKILVQLQAGVQSILLCAACLLSPLAYAVDTDADGLDDSVETNTGTYVSPADTGTDPNDPDTDSDIIPDALDLPPNRNPLVADWAVSAGIEHTCALDDSGVVCWGSNNYMQRVVPALTNPVAVSAGGYHTCALDDSGVVCWGRNDYGQRNVPVLTNPVAVSAGGYHSCALDDSGVICRGRNDFGQVNVPGLANPVAVSAGLNHTCALDDNGIVCWGNSNYGRTTVPPLTNPVTVSAGGYHTCAVDDSGVVCWGFNSHGQTTVPALSNPVAVNADGYHTCAVDDSGVVCWGRNSFGQTTVPALTNPVAVSTGWEHTCALDTSGVVCWGRPAWTTVPALAFDKDMDGLSDDVEDANGNGVVDAGETDPLNPDTDNDGALDGSDAFPLDPAESVDTDGDGTGNNADTDDDNDTIPDIFDQPPDRNPLVADWAVNAGESFTCALDDSSVVCWGFNNDGQTTVPALSNPVAVSAGGAHTCALDDSGVVCWGDNSSFGQATVPALSNPVTVSAGGNHTCARDDSGVVCWGQPTFGQTAVPALSNPVAVSAGAINTCALDDAGVVCWGDNSNGQTTVPPLSNPVAVSAGGYHICALDNTGVVCWGANGDGQTTVPPLSNPIAVSSGNWHTCALDDSGVVCWGYSTAGQTTVPALSNPVAVSAGGNHTCALDDSGVVCWGNNSNGQSMVPTLAFDKDLDGVPDIIDAFPLDPAESVDTDGDGIGNNADNDDDNDTLLDGADNCPLIINLDQNDNDSDGAGDACDPDDDNDSYSDYYEKNQGGDPLDPASTPTATARVLLVDDEDQDLPYSVGTFISSYTNALNDAPADYDYFHQGIAGTEPLSGTLEQYDLIIWSSGSAVTGAGPEMSSEARLATYLDNGGCLFLNSGHYLTDKAFGDGTNATLTSFMTNYLGLASAIHNPYQSSSATQITFDAAGSLAGSMQYTDNLTQAKKWDHLTPGAGGQVSATATETTYGTKTVGVEKIGTNYRSFFWSAPLEDELTTVNHGQLIRGIETACGISTDPVHHYNFERAWPTLAVPWYFSYITDVGTDADGNVYVLDQGNDRIAKFSPAGIEITSWAAVGYARLSAIITPPDWAITVSDDGHVYVLADTNNAQTFKWKVRKFTQEGEFFNTEWTETAQGSGGHGIDVGPDGNVYVLAGNGDIRKYSPTGQLLQNIGISQKAQRFAIGSNSVIYYTLQGEFDDSIIGDSIYRMDLAGQSLGSPVVTGQDIREIQVDANGYILVSGTGSVNEELQAYTDAGVAVANSSLQKPVGLDRFVLPANGERIYWFHPTYNTAVGVVVDGMEKVVQVRNRPPVGSGGSSGIVADWTSRGDPVNGFDSPYMFNGPESVAIVDAVDEVYIADSGNNRVKVFKASDGSYLREFSLAGTAADGIGHTLVADTQGLFFWDEITDKIYEFDSLGVYQQPWVDLSASFGSVGSINAHNGRLYYLNRSEEEINRPPDSVRVLSAPSTEDISHTFTAEDGHTVQNIRQFSVAPNGDVYALEDYNSNWWVHRENSNGSAISSVLLNYQIATESGSSDKPVGLTVGEAGFMFYIDPNADTIIRFDPDGEVAQQLGDTADVARYGDLVDMTLDGSGRVYATDVGLNRVQVMRAVQQADSTRAIVVAGGGNYPGNLLWPATRAMANKAYDTLALQGFGPDSIQYLSDDPAARVDAVANKANLQSAITSWALTDSDGDGQPDAQNIILYMDDHGGNKTFRMSETETLSDAELDGWLSTLEAVINGEVIVIYDACQSGSFSPLSNFRRTVITSSNASEPAYFTNQGFMSFSNYFLNGVLSGYSVGDAFSFAWKGVNSASTSQTPQLDADGDGSVNTGYDSSGSPNLPASGDYAAAQNKFLGNGTTNFLQGPLFCSPEPCTPQVSASITSGNTGTITASSVSDPDGVNRVWAIIYSPNIQVQNPDTPILELPTVELIETPEGSGSYTATYDDFSSQGTYQILISAADGLGYPSAPEVVNLMVGNPLTRRAIIVAGEGSAYWQAADTVYQALRAQGYGDDEIDYRSAGNTPGIDSSPTLASLQADLAAMDGTDTQDVTLFLIGSSDGVSFSLSSTESLAASQLDGLLNGLVSVANPITGKLAVIMDADNAGFYLERLDLTAASGGEDFYRIASTISGVAHFEGNGSVSYTQFFVGNVANGATVPVAHLLARQAMFATSSGQQQAWLDTNSDDTSDKFDISRIINYSLGPGILLAGDDPVIGSAGVDGFVAGADQMAVTLWANDITTTGTLNAVWALVTPPDTDGFGGTDPLPVKVVLTYNGTRHEAAYNLPSPLGGTYTVSIYAQDTDGAVSLPWTETLTREDAYEIDNSEVQASVILVDNPAQYHSFHTVNDVDWVGFAATAGTTYTITADPVGEGADVVLSVKDPGGGTVMIDDLPAGEHPLGAETYIFTVATTGTYNVKVSLDNTVSPPNVPSDYTLAVTTDGGGSGTTSVAGQVRAPDGNPVEFAFVKIEGNGGTTGVASTLSVTPNGDYSIGDGPGTYALTAQKSGYLLTDAGTITIPEQGTTIRNITLMPDGPVDTDGDGIPDGSDPYVNSVDGDSDGLCDGPNTIAGVCVAGEDLNANGVVDSGETDPESADTDSDGFTDGDELYYNSDPLSQTDTPANGDVNDDGVVNVADVLMATRFVTGQLIPDDDQRTRADVAPFIGGIPVPDGEINAGDLVRIQRMALGM